MLAAAASRFVDFISGVNWILGKLGCQECWMIFLHEIIKQQVLRKLKIWSVTKLKITLGLRWVLWPSSCVSHFSLQKISLLLLWLSKCVWHTYIITSIAHAWSFPGCLPAAMEEASEVVLYSGGLRIDGHPGRDNISWWSYREGRKGRVGHGTDDLSVD